MEGLEIVVVLLTAVLGLTWVARRLRLSEPVCLLAGGVLIGLIPAFRSVRLPGDLVLLIFLPPLLYAESLTISLHQIRANLRVIVLLSVGLVLATALTVAGTAHGLGMVWPMAFVLGAVLAPTDATAVAGVARGMPRRTLTTMRAESLMNDGTALVVFAVAVQIAVGRSAFAWGEATWRFALSYVGGMAIGAAGALLAITLRRRIDDGEIETGLSVLTPFAVYLPAEAAGVSGVLAVVMCGLIISRASPLLTRASSRLQTIAFWQVSTFLLNGSLFVLVGMQLPSAVLGLRSLGLGRALLLAAAVSAAVILTRLLYLHSTPYLIRAVDRRPQQRARRVGARQRMPVAWGGVRGAVSLAAALAVPTYAADGSRLQGRDVIVFVTAAVIVVTLLFQGQTLPLVIRWSRLPEDPTEDSEEILARQHVVESALDELPGHAERLGASQEVVDRLTEELSERAERLRADDEPADEAEHELRRALLAAKRTALVALRDARRIDDAVLRRVQETLDREELRLEARALAARAAAQRRSRAAGGRDGGGDEEGDGDGRGRDDI
ncbi:Na+/H+ antiporter [Streptomyces sp. NPDC051569]|uniref:Na+/H+ antiporter n=1 Tax=Streptomyces sp. NPDC051569 TaxID=3365661 RepID=UPI0037B0EA4E